MPVREDYLLRLVDRLTALARAALGGSSAELAAVEAEAAEAAGISLDLAATLTTPSVLMLLTTIDGLDAGRALALAMGLAARGRRLGGAKGDALLDRARALAGHALAERPDLDRPDLRALLQ
jgi:hypothetical protein